MKFILIVLLVTQFVAFAVYITKDRGFKKALARVRLNQLIDALDVYQRNGFQYSDMDKALELLAIFERHTGNDKLALKGCQLIRCNYIEAGYKTLKEVRIKWQR